MLMVKEAAGELLLKCLSWWWTRDW